MNHEPFPGKKIILFRTDRLGDLILSFPAVEAIKLSIPEARIDLLTHASTAPLAALQENVFRVVPDIYHGPKGFRELVRSLKAEAYDAVVHLHPRPRLALATFLARIPVRVGTAYRYYSPLFNNRVRIHKKHMLMHERDLNLKLLETLGIPSNPDVTPGIRVPERALTNVRDLLSSMGIPPSAPFVVLHPGSGASSLNWPPEHYGSLGRAFIQMGVRVALTGTDGERPIVSEVQDRMGKGAVDLCGRLDLEHLAALLFRASLTISNSTGPLHLADALGRKVIGLYSPHFYSSPQRWGPYSQPENVFVPEGRICVRCPQHRCREFNCMKKIPPEAVLKRVKELFSPESRFVG